MADFVPPKKNDANGFIFYIGLTPRAATGAFQSNPTLATGDFKVSIDGGSFTNLGTTPSVSPASGKAVKITLSQSEINGDNITVLGSDAAGAEWNDVIINFQTATRQLQDLAYPATSGRSITVDASGNANANLVNIAGSAVNTSTAQLGVNAVNAGGTAWGSGAITAGSIAASALNGKGDWNVGKTGYSLTATTGLGNQTANITGNLSGSVGSVTGNVGGNVTGSVGSVVGLTASNLDATISSRLASASYTAPDNTSIAAILVDTAEIGVAGAGLTALASATNLATANTNVSAIKAKTDSLAFTVAGQVNANIKSVADTTVTGTGTTADPWGP